MRSGPSAAITSCKARRHRKRSGGPSGTSAKASIGSGRVQQPKRARWELCFLAVLSKPTPAGITVNGLRRKDGLGQFRNVAVLSDQSAHATCSQTGAQTIDKTTKLRCILAAGYADLFGRTGFGDNNRQPCHVEAEAGIECICKCNEPLYE